MSNQRRFILLLVITLAIAGVASAPTAASASAIASASQESADLDAFSQFAIEHVKNFLEKGYSPYYVINEITTDVRCVSVTEQGDLECIILAVMNSTLRAQSVEELPYIQGMISAAKSNGLSAMQQDAAKSAITTKMAEVAEYIGKADNVSFVFKLTARTGERGFDRQSVQFMAESYDRYLPAEELLPKTALEMAHDGAEELQQSLKRTASLSVEAAPAFYSGYDRIKARDYANTYTSNAQVYCSHGTADGAQQDTSFWNTKVYPAYLDVFCHNDCADYVSQALAHGGIPTTSSWFRGSGLWNWSGSWASAQGLKDYMTGQGYWQESNHTNAAAGGVITFHRVLPNGELGDIYHVVMIVKNDTITRAYSGHTWDQLEHVYSARSDWKYWTLW